jgi:adenylosuccinate synthase
MNKVDVLLGLQWGDEGKGKIVDVLTPVYDVIARFQGGPNAGHSLEFNDIKHVLHTIPSGIFHKEKINLIGNGVVIDPVVFKNETDALEKMGVSPVDSIYISKKRI